MCGVWCVVGVDVVETLGGVSVRATEREHVVTATHTQSTHLSYQGTLDSCLVRIIIYCPLSGHCILPLCVYAGVSG